MKNLLSLLALVMGSFVYSQTTVYAVESDQLELNIEDKEYSGALQWQESEDGKNWSDISGATSETYSHTIEKTPSYYKAKFSSQSCEFFSETITVMDTIRTGYIEESIAEIEATPELVHIYSGNLPSQKLLDMPPVRNQGAQGSCSAWAVTYYLMGYLKHEAEQAPYIVDGQNDKTVLMSPAYTFNQVKAADKDEDCGGSGAIQHLSKLKSQGVCSLADMPYKASDCETQPNEQQREAASDNKISQYFKVSRDNIPLLKTILGLGKPLVLAISSNAELKKLKSPYVWTPGDKGSGHSVTLCGYSDDLQQFRVVNSWGKNWGSNGYFNMTYNGFQSLPNGKQCYTAFWKSNPAFNNLTLNLQNHFLLDGNASDEKQSTSTSQSLTPSTNRKGIDQKAVAFSGTDSYIASNENLESNAFSVSFWVNPKSKPESSQALFSQINEQLSPSLGIELSITNNILTLSVPSGGQAHTLLTAPEEIQEDSWYHLAVTYDGKFIRFYVNSIPVKIGVYTTFFNTDEAGFTIGCRQADAQGKKSNFFEGKMDDLRIYSREINDAEIEELFNQ